MCNMKKNRKKIWIIAIAVVVFTVATIIANIRLTAALDAEYAAGEEVYYEMGDTVDYGENHVYYIYDDDLDGYSVRVDCAEVLTYEELLEHIGQTADSMTEMLGSTTVSSMPEKVLFITAVFANEDSDAEGIKLSEITCHGPTYYMSFDAVLTIVSNEFLLNEYADSLPAYSSPGFYLDHHEEATVYIVYDFSKFFFTARHWENLEDESIYLQITSYPLQQRIMLTLGS